MVNFKYFMYSLLKTWWLWLVIIFAAIATYQVEKLDKEVE